jgi:hypothetical protein
MNGPQYQGLGRSPSPSAANDVTLRRTAISAVRGKGVSIVDTHDNAVLERLATTESTTLSLKREDGGKIRVTSLLWPEPHVILKGEVLEILMSWRSAHRQEGAEARRMGPTAAGLRSSWAGQWLAGRRPLP